MKRLEQAKAILRAVFTRSVRRYIYGVAFAADSALVVLHVLPPLSLVALGPFLLALLNLNPKDVDRG